MLSTVIYMYIHSYIVGTICEGGGSEMSELATQRVLRAGVQRRLYYRRSGWLSAGVQRHTVLSTQRVFIYPYEEMCGA